MAKKWRKNNMNSAATRKQCDEKLAFLRGLTSDADYVFRDEIARIERVRNGAIFITRKEARTFYAAEQAQPTGLIMKLIYGSNWMDLLEKIRQLHEARENFKTINPGKALPGELNDALAVR